MGAYSQAEMFPHYSEPLAPTSALATIVLSTKALAMQHMDTTQ